MSDPVSLRPKLPRAWLALGAGMVGGLVVILMTARVTPVEPSASPPPAIEPPKPLVCPAPIPPWNLEAQPVQRIGYSGGRRHMFDVVALGPTEVEVEVGTARAFLAMRDAAAKACVDLRLASGFRTVEEQRELFRAWRRGRGNKAARPGQSNHQSGRALDIAVLAPGALAWLETYAALYGFKRTVRSEPWHWEYVDGPIAYALVSKRVSRKVKLAKAVRTTRPAKRTSSIAKTPRASKRRVATSR